MFEEGEFPIYKEMLEISHQAKLRPTPSPSIRHDVHRVPSELHPANNRFSRVLQ